VKNRILPIISFILLSLLLGGCQEKELITGRDKVFVGEAIQLIIDNRIEMDHLWASSNEEIAIVDELTVLPTSTLLISGDDFVLIGESTQLEATSSIEDDVIIWSSGDEAIATVLNGLVVGISEGTVEIQVSSSYYGFAMMAFHVIKDYTPERIDVVNVPDTYIIEEGPFSLEAVASPHYTSQEFYWEISGSKATIDRESGLITFLEEGTTYVICRSRLSNTVFKVATLTAKHDPEVEVTRILFIGNSLTYVNEIPKMIERMARSSGKVVYCDSITEGGASIYGLYTTRYQTIVTMLEAKDYTYIVLQEQSSGSYSNYQQFITGVSSFKTLADLYNIEVILYQTWPYKEGSSALLGQQKSQVEMLNAIVEAYNNAGIEYDASVNPVGEVFYAFLQAYPSIELYMDANHASLAGSYLSSCVHYVKIFGESVVDNGYELALENDVKLTIETFVSNYFLSN
jgi:hypothetical protein